MLTKLNSKALAQVLIGYVNTLPHNKTNYFSPKEYLFRLISINSSIKDSWGVGKNSAIYLSESELLRTRTELKDSISSRLNTVLSEDSISFINSDQLTKSVLVYTEKYLDDLVSGEAHLGEAIQNYNTIWYLGKTGVNGPSKSKEHAEKFQTFSKSEVQNLREGFIPIAVASKNIPVFLDNLELILSVSTLKDFMRVDTAANPLGINVTGSRCWWIPKVVAKEYLEETDDLKVLSSRVLYKLLYDAGLYEAPANPEVRELQITDLDISKARSDISSSLEEKFQTKTISRDFRQKDDSTRRASVSSCAIELGELNI